MDWAASRVAALAGMAATAPFRWMTGSIGNGSGCGQTQPARRDHSVDEPLTVGRTGPCCPTTGACPARQPDPSATSYPLPVESSWELP